MESLGVLILGLLIISINSQTNESTNTGAPPPPPSNNLPAVDLVQLMEKSILNQAGSKLTEAVQPSSNILASSNVASDLQDKGKTLGWMDTTVDQQSVISDQASKASSLDPMAAVFKNMGGLNLDNAAAMLQEVVDSPTGNAETSAAAKTDKSTNAATTSGNTGSGSIFDLWDQPLESIEPSQTDTVAGGSGPKQGATELPSAAPKSSGTEALITPPKSSGTEASITLPESSGTESLKTSANNVVSGYKEPISPFSDIGDPSRISTVNFPRHSFDSFDTKPAAKNIFMKEKNEQNNLQNNLRQSVVLKELTDLDVFGRRFVQNVISETEAGAARNAGSLKEGSESIPFEQTLFSSPDPQESNIGAPISNPGTGNTFTFGENLHLFGLPQGTHASSEHSQNFPNTQPSGNKQFEMQVPTSHNVPDLTSNTGPNIQTFDTEPPAAPSRPITGQTRGSYPYHPCQENYQEEPTSFHFYRQLDNGRWIQRRCPNGVRYNPINCTCTLPIPKSDTEGCQPSLRMQFTYGLQDTSRLQLLKTYDLAGLRTVNESLCFNGSQDLKIPKYNSYEFKYFYLTLKFRTDNARYYPLPQAILSNCGGRDIVPSFGIMLINVTSEADIGRFLNVSIFVNTTGRFIYHYFKAIPHQWNTIHLAYDGQRFDTTVNDETITRYTQGVIRRTNGDLTFAHCAKYDYFKGCIDDVELYTCKRDFNQSVR